MSRWLALLLVVFACASVEEPRMAEGEAWLSELEAAHALVDRELAAERPEAAEQALRSLTEGSAPQGVTERHHRKALQDVYFRLGSLYLKRGANEDALETAQAGINLGEADDVFFVNLLLIKAQGQENLGRKAEASDSYLRALKINKKLLREVLGEQEKI